MPENPDAVVSGVDLGTLPGRAVERLAGTTPVPGGRKGLLT
jgi:hypothetical protein